MKQFSFKIPTFKTIIIDELKNYEEWVSLQFLGMSVSNISKKTESELKLAVKEISLTDLSLPIN